MTIFRFKVSRAGNGYLAEDGVLGLMAGGATIEEASDQLRSMAAVVTGTQMPVSLIMRLETDKYIAFVMRPFRKPFKIHDPTHETVYFDSLGRTKPDRAFAARAS